MWAYHRAFDVALCPRIEAVRVSVVVPAVYRLPSAPSASDAIDLHGTFHWITHSVWATTVCNRVPKGSTVASLSMQQGADGRLDIAADARNVLDGARRIFVWRPERSTATLPILPDLLQLGVASAPAISSSFTDCLVATNVDAAVSLSGLEELVGICMQVTCQQCACVHVHTIR